MSIKIENIVGPSAAQWVGVIRGMRNPLNSWDKSDSGIQADETIYIGRADMDLMKRLAKAGSDHRKFLRMLPVIMDVTAPLYWWKEEDQYKIATVSNSCSTMHKIHDKEFTLEDFSCEHLTGSLSVMNEVIKCLNHNRSCFIETKDKHFWWQMIQLLPSSYNQKRTLLLNYEVLWNMYGARKNHKLDEWREFCETIVREVPYFREIFSLEEEGDG